jgi:hypothetical protein
MKSPAIILGALLVLGLPSVALSTGLQMKGGDWATRGYREAAIEKMKLTCSEHVARCIHRGQEPSVCQSRGEQCRQTGVFIGHKGAHLIASERL